MSRYSRDAVDYCISLGLDPHEVVMGWFVWQGVGETVLKPRWHFYINTTGHPR